jgi:hypothetical protein
MIQLDETLTTTSRNRPRKKQCLGYKFFLFSVGKKTRVTTHREKIVWLARTYKNPLGRPDENPFSLGKNPEALTEQQEGGSPAKKLY